MSLSLLLRNAADTSTLADLNGTGAADIKVVYFQLGDPVVDEVWSFSWHADGGELAKAPLRPRRAKIGLAIPAQANIATLRTKVEAIRDALLTTGNLLKETWYAETARKHRIIRSVVPSILEGDTEYARRVAVNLLIPLWPIEVWVDPTAVGEIRSPVL